MPSLNSGSQPGGSKGYSRNSLAPAAKCTYKLINNPTPLVQVWGEKAKFRF